LVVAGFSEALAEALRLNVENGAVVNESVDGGDDADQWILTGIHTVNRICYLVTEVPHNWMDIQFRIPARGYALTRIGLLRQMNKISRSMSEIQAA